VITLIHWRLFSSEFALYSINHAFFGVLGISGGNNRDTSIMMNEVHTNITIYIR